MATLPFNAGNALCRYFGKYEGTAPQIWDLKEEAPAYLWRLVKEKFVTAEEDSTFGNRPWVLFRMTSKGRQECYKASMRG